MELKELTYIKDTPKLSSLLELLNKNQIKTLNLNQL